MEEFTKSDFEYIKEPFNYYDKKYLQGVKRIHIKNLSENDIARFQMKQKKNITKLKGELTEKRKERKSLYY